MNPDLISSYPVPEAFRFGGKLINWQEPRIMGILNITPDSFFPESRITDINNALKQAENMLTTGVEILDLGGMSTRPGAEETDEEEELKRLLPVVEKLSHEFPEAILSVDTYRSNVAKECLKAGAHWINDISAGDADPEMLGVIAAGSCPYILMHKQGTPATMQLNPQYDNVVTEVFDYLKNKVEQCRSLGIHQVIIDPGFGFGKNVNHNFTLFRHLGIFQEIGVPVLTGISRKGMIWKTLGITPGEALIGTTALHMAALLAGTQLIRVHDATAAVQVRSLFLAIRDRSEG